MPSVRRLFVLVFVALATVLARVEQVSAAPITVNFEAQWSFNDFEWKFLGCDVLPEQCGFASGINQLGVDNQSTVYFSFNFDDSAPDVDPAADIGNYLSGVSGTLRLGSAQWHIGLAQAYITPGALTVWAHLQGPHLRGSPLFMEPDFFHLHFYNPFITSGSLAGIDWAQIATGPIQDWRPWAIVNFNPGNNHGNMHITRVTVPEAGSVPLAVGAAAALVFLRRRRPLSFHHARNSAG